MPNLEAVCFVINTAQVLTVSFGNSSVTADTVYQINLMTPKDMALVLEAIADNLRNGPSDQPEEEF